jgi:hypothetical protein
MSPLFTLDLAALQNTAVGVLGAWVLSQSIAWVYAWTRRGQDVSRAFVQALVVGGIVGAMLMLAIGNSLARGIGIVGALAFIRFRTNLRDALDMVFMFASFAAGIAAGTGNLLAGAVGTGMFLAVAASLRVFAVEGGAREAELRVRVKGPDGETRVRAVLAAQARSSTLLKRRDSGDAEARMWWRVALLGDDDGAALCRALLAVEGAVEVQLSLDPAPATGGADDD